MPDYSSFSEDVASPLVGGVRTLVNFDAGDKPRRYDTGFPLVRLHDFSEMERWKSSIQGAHAFAVSGAIVLVSGGYKDSENFHLLQLLQDGKMKQLRKIRFSGSSGDVLTNPLVIGRGPFMHFTADGRYYRVSALDLC